MGERSPNFRDNSVVSSVKDGTTNLSRNVEDQSHSDVALYSSRRTAAKA